MSSFLKIKFYIKLLLASLKHLLASREACYGFPVAAYNLFRKPPEPEFVNFLGAQESIPRNWFKSIPPADVAWRACTVRQPYSILVPVRQAT